MDHYVEELLHTLVHVTATPFTADTALPVVREALGLDSNNYRNGVTQAVYGELDPLKSTTTLRYKTLVVAYAVSKTVTKGYDYSRNIKTGATPSLNDKLATEAHKIAVPLYRNYLESGIKEKGFANGPDFLTLFNDADFCLAFARRVLQKEFITNQLIAVYAGGNKAYPQGVAYLYERMRKTLVRTPANRGDIHGEAPDFIGQKTARDHWKPIAEEHQHFIKNPQQLSDFLELSLPLKWSDQDALQEPSFAFIGRLFNIEFLKSSDIVNLGRSVCGKTDSKEEISSSFPTRAPPPLVTYTYYGREVVEWMNKQASGDYSDVFDHGDVYSTSKYSSPLALGSCFTPGTMVRTEEGNAPVQTLTHGDRVLARLPGSYGTVSNEKVEVLTGGSVWLYGFNDEEPFFTGGHVFITKAGPRAMVPEIARMENPDIQVHQISVGDVLYRINDSDPTTYVEVEVTKIAIKQRRLEYVYGIHFRKGAKGTCSYHANGYLVVANYPEITLKRLKDNFITLSPKERRTFSKTIADLPSSFKTALGPMLTGSLENAFNAPQSFTQHFETRKAHFKSETDKRHLPSGHLIRHFPLIHWGNFRTRKSGFTGGELHQLKTVQDINGITNHILPQISVSQGAVLINEKLVKHARADGKEIHWSRPLGDEESGEWEHGMLKTSADGFWAYGAIGTGPGPLATPAIHSPSTLKNTVSVFAAANANDYNLLYTIQGASNDGTFKTDSDANSTAYPGSCAWGAFNKMETGLNITPNGAVDVQVTFPDLDARWQEAVAGTSTTVIPYELLKKSINTSSWALEISVKVAEGVEDLLPDVCGTDLIPFYTIDVWVDLATNVVSGNFTELILINDLLNKWGAGSRRAIHCPYSPKASALKDMALKAVRESTLQTSDGIPQALTANLHTISSNVHHEPSPLTKHLSVLATESNDDLPIPFLQQMTTPDDDKLHERSQDYMMAAASFWRSDKETKVFGDEKGAVNAMLPDDLKSNLRTDCQTFLGSSFSRTLLNYSMSRNKTYEGRYSDAQKDKLQFWWTGKTPNCLARKKEYNDVTAITARIAFNELADDGFKPYRDSPTDYADRLFKAVTDDSILKNLANSVIFGNQNLVNRFCAILNALDRENRNFDKELWSLVQQKQIYAMATGSPNFGNDFSAFMKTYMEDLAKNIESGSSSISEDLRDQMKIDLDQLYATVEAKDAADLAFKLFDSSTDLMENILIVIDYFKRRPMTGGQGNAASFFKKLGERINSNPKLSKLMTSIKGFVMVGMQAYALYSAISFLMNWGDLSGARRAAAILTCLEAVLRSIYDLAATWAELRNLAPDSVAFKVRCLEWNNASKGKVKFQDADSNEKPVIDEKAIQRVELIQEDGTVPPGVKERSISEQISEKGVTTEVSAEANIAKEFSLSSAVVEGVMVAVNIASAVVLGIELASEWDKVDKGIRAMDTINLVVVCTQALTGIIGVTSLVVGAELSCLPGVGIALCAAGLVMMLVEQFVPHPKPDPVQDYLDETGYQHVNGLDSPPSPELQYSTVKTVLPSGQIQLDMTVIQPAPLTPSPMVKQFIVKVFAGTSEGDLFQPPTTDTNGNVTGNHITWSLANSVNGGFQIVGNDNPSKSDDSIIGRVYPTTPATYTGKEHTLESAGTSIIGVGNHLTVRIVGSPNANFKSMLGSITEILENPPDGVAGSDVIWRFTI